MEFHAQITGRDAQRSQQRTTTGHKTVILQHTFAGCTREYLMTWTFADRRIAESDRRCTSVCRNTDERTGFNPGDRIFILSRDDHLGSGRRFFVHGHHNHGQGVGTTRAGDVFFRAGGSRHIGSLFLLRSHPPPLNLSQRPITILITATV